MEEKYVIVLITVPKENSQDLMDKILEKKLGACINKIEEVFSKYWWKGTIEESKESLLIIKTRKDKLLDLRTLVKENHPYTVPEILALPIYWGNECYIKWIDESIGD